MQSVCPTRTNGSQRPFGFTGHCGPVTEKRRRVFHTAGLAASAAVLALSLQAGPTDSDDDSPPVNLYGDATILDPDDTA